MVVENEDGSVTPCAGCPWRAENHGKEPFEEPPEGYRAKGEDFEKDWYGEENAQRLWKGMRRGEMMSCHASDPNQWEHLDDEEDPEICAGLLVIVIRELNILEECCEEAEAEGERNGLERYLERRPEGLTREGVVRWTERVLFGALPGVAEIANKVRLEGDAFVQGRDDTGRGEEA